MKTYIINLKDSVDRKEYMEKQLEKMPFLLAEFIDAVDGRKMTESDKIRSFDAELYRKRYAKEVRPGEIGCTLSHQKCYKQLIGSGEKYVLILEDDIVVRQNIENLIPEIEKLLNEDAPRLILLSGWYWFLGTKKLNKDYRIANVYDGFLTHAYALNRAAAALLVEQRPYFIADDWYYIRKRGVNVQALLPHVLDQDWSGNYPTLIQVKGKGCHGMWKRKIEIRFHSLFLKTLRLIRRFEKP